MSPYDGCIFLPGHPGLTSASAEPLAPGMTDLLIELPDISVVRRAPVILVVAPEFSVKGFLLLIHRHVAVLPASFGDCRQAPSVPLLYRSHVHGALPLCAPCHSVRERE